jgi:hypothetical protein
MAVRIWVEGDGRETLEKRVSTYNAFTDIHKLVLKEKPFCPRGRFFSLWINKLFSPPPVHEWLAAV